MNTIGEVLEMLRRARGLTQEELCSRTGVTQAALSRYENDQRMPDDETITRLARELGVSRRFLLRDHVVRGALVVDVHMRRHKTTKASVWRRLEARLNNPVGRRPSGAPDQQREPNRPEATDVCP
ncbi:MAG TPA: helix-turn-helix transcriptional regulator [Amycolatopsis sp.]|uniref:helix-turn-helix domain-containing protein n=1 Tax=Amycolatopsis sp. TaxID=37632 RepID=UPI002B49F22D|nr:helix-turn-helix transcriptional regulator [Amycolatopsis sp.]HKS49591.1 helix-turn-helix transcriptional regulator [Amycolatopsis sp.]